MNHETWNLPADNNAARESILLISNFNFKSKEVQKLIFSRFDCRPLQIKPNPDLNHPSPAIIQGLGSELTIVP